MSPADAAQWLVGRKTRSACAGKSRAVFVMGLLNMGRVSLIVLSAILSLAVWTGILTAGALEGWWRQPLAPSGDRRAFMDAAIAEIDKTRRGNVAFVLIEEGKVFDEHFTSVGQPVDRDTLFQVASMSK